jgi:hypothetical protein
MEAERSTETSIINYQLTERHISEDCNICEKRCENQKIRKYNAFLRNINVIRNDILFLYLTQNSVPLTFFWQVSRKLHKTSKKKLGNFDNKNLNGSNHLVELRVEGMIILN